ncbi:DUF3300 domain-containing protein [Rhodopseudomonas pseudopalustris]|uniref:DUF3300 domain-containing protein n=1 Tax=Rhodopseudomonas pseudopalustris TaxID=1513892 RepID=UPI003F9D0275
MTSTTRSMIAVLFLTIFQASFAHAQTPAPSDINQSQQLLKAGELDQLVAPIALYPDALLATVLMASTYPLEVVQADRWATENKALKGDQLKAAVDKQSWDGSVKSLIATPSVLSMMSTKLDWTQKLGDAVLAQQADVMDAIQRLRTKAQANNKLVSNKQQKVTVTQQESRQVIVIEPTSPDTIYVPYYDPAIVYGTWSYADYPPYYFAPPLGYVPGAVLATGIAFGAGYAVGRWASGGNYWGGGVNWGRNNINVNRPVNVNTGNINVGNTWQHNPVHRQGVKYSNTNVQQKFGNNNIRAGGNDRLDFRGRGGDQVLRPGNAGGNLGGGANLGGGNGLGNRPSVADRTPGNRPDAGNRPSAGGNRPVANRPSAGTNRPAGGGTPRRDSAMGNIQSGRVANAQAARGRESLGGGRVAAARVGSGGGAARVGAGGGGGPRMGAGGGGGPRMGGGGGGRGGGGGGRRSDINAKHDITLLGRLDNGLGFYRYSYNGSNKAYVGVMAQEVQAVMPEAVVRGRDGYLRVFYDKLGLTFETYDHWVASGARIPSATAMRHTQTNFR